MSLIASRATGAIHVSNEEKRLIFQSQYHVLSRFFFMALFFKTLGNSIQWTTIDAVFLRNQTMLNRSFVCIVVAARNRVVKAKD